MTSIYISLQLTIHTCDRIQADNSWANGGSIHSDPYSRLYYLRSGTAEVRRGDTQIELQTGSLYLLPAYVSHWYRCPVAMDLSYIHFSAMLAGLGPLHQFVSWPVEVRCPDQDWVEERMDLLLEERDAASYLTRDGALRQLLGLFDDAAKDRPGLAAAAGRLAPVLRYIESNLSRKITLTELAQEAHLQPNYFSDLFRKQFGEAPTRYIQRRRIEQAAEQLAITDVSLKVLADDLGFTDAFHLSRTFKSLMGVSPSVYRKQLLRDV